MNDVSVLSARGLSKRFGSVVALEGIDFDIRPGEVRALCGENGAGKSTFIKLLTGVYQPDAGSVQVSGFHRPIRSPREAQAAGIALVAQELSVCPELSVEDNIWLGTLGVPFLHKRSELRRKARAALDLLGMQAIPLHVPLATLSLGERQIVEIARMLTRDARVLLLDEPTATLSDNEIARMSAALRSLKREGRSIIYITHRMGEVFDLCDTVTVFRNGKHVATRGVEGLDRSELVELMLGRPHDTMYPPAQRTSGVVRLSVSGLTVPGRVSGLNLDVPAGTICGLAGQIGSCAEDAIRAIAGLEYAAHGDVRVNARRITLGSAESALRNDVMYVSGDRAAEGVFQELSVGENLTALRLDQHTRVGVLHRRSLRDKARDLARQVKVDLGRIGSRANELSGGNQQTIAIGRCLDRGRPGVVVMNEPTRGIDVGARAEIYALMRQFCANGHAVVVASTDLEEVIGLGDSVVTLYRGRRVASYPRGQATMQQVVTDITHPVA